MSDKKNEKPNSEKQTSESRFGYEPEIKPEVIVPNQAAGYTPDTDPLGSTLPDAPKGGTGESPEPEGKEDTKD